MERAWRAVSAHLMLLYREASGLREVQTKGRTICMESIWRSRFTFSKHLGPPLDSPCNHDNHPAGWRPPPCLSPKGGLRGREAIAIVFFIAVITVAVVRGTPSVVINGWRRQISISFSELHRLRRAATGKPSPR